MKMTAKPSMVITSQEEAASDSNIKNGHELLKKYSDGTIPTIVARRAQKDGPIVSQKNASEII